ncbi:hypothetical protein V6N13_074853 [Hibiscus sabdariffa]
MRHEATFETGIGVRIAKGAHTYLFSIFTDDNLIFGEATVRDPLIRHRVELYNSMVEKEGTEDEEEAKKAYQAAREHSDHTAQKASGDKVSSALIDRVDAMLQKLENEIDDVDAKIGDRWRLLDRFMLLGIES